jgi:sialate O-acetylesterase
MPQAALEDILTPEQIAKKKEASSVKPTELYCAMIAPIRNFTAKGFLWYQGCSNLDDNDHYDTMMARMAEQWRKDWGDSKNEMPFYYVMITPYSYGDSNAISYPLFVENQARALEKIPNSGMAATTDIGEETCIHPSKKFEVGQRLAALALAKTYGQLGFEADAPQMAAYSIKDGKAVITISNSENGLSPWYGEAVVGFEIAGADKVFHKAQATISAQKEVTVWSDEVKQPVAVRYSFRNFAPGNLKNMFGIPVIPFRTDDWNDVK